MVPGLLEVDSPVREGTVDENESEGCCGGCGDGSALREK